MTTKEKDRLADLLTLLENELSTVTPDDVELEKKVYAIEDVRDLLQAL